MKEPNVNNRVVICVVNAIALLAAAAVAAQSQAPPPAQDKAKAKGVTVGLYANQRPAPTGPVPKLADGTVDLTGVWLGGGSSDADMTRAVKPGDKLEMLPWAE